MSNLMGGKQYGLILQKPGAQKSESSLVRKKPSIFNQSDSDSDKSDGDDWVKKSMKGKAAKSSGLKKQTKIVMAKALEEDPTVFQYDEVYDKMEDKKAEEVEKKKTVDRQPKYIKNLLKSAEIRNKEFERRIERKVQKEREAEGEMFADKESFVTGAYRKKMEEMAKEEEEEQRKERIEAALDVTKQNDLSGFYRHLYRQTHGEEKSEMEDKIKKEEEEKIKKEKEEIEESLEEKAKRVKEQMKKIKVEENPPEEEDAADDVHIKKINRKREFRKKEVAEDSESSSSESDSEVEDEKEDTSLHGKKEVTLSAEEKMAQRKQEMKEQKERREKRKRKIEQDESSSDSEPETEVKKSKDTVDDQPDDEVTVQPAAVDDTPKIDIWKKRTVGEVYEDAVARYWKRVAERSRGN